MLSDAALPKSETKLSREAGEHEAASSTNSTVDVSECYASTHLGKNEAMLPVHYKALDTPTVQPHSITTISAGVGCCDEQPPSVAACARFTTGCGRETNRAQHA